MLHSTKMMMLSISSTAFCTLHLTVLFFLPLHSTLLDSF
jgi:hypothetical protein